MKNKLKYHFFKTLFKAKNLVSIQPLWNKENKVLILCYHGIVKSNATKFNSRFVTLSDFENHLKFFKNSENINVVSLQNAIDKKIDAHKLNIAITFDDGYSNVVKYACPLLSEHNYPASFCITNLRESEILWNDLLDICTLLWPDQSIKLDNKILKFGRDKHLIFKSVIEHGLDKLNEFYLACSDSIELIKNQSDLADYWQLLSQVQIQEIANNALFEIIPHGANHLNLKFAPHKDVILEIDTSIQNIRSLGGRPSTYCLAYGDYSQFSIEHIRSKNIQNILGLNDIEPDVISRFSINPHVSFGVLKHFILKGSYI